LPRLAAFVFFVPLLILNLAAISGHFILPEGFSWIGSTYATLAFTIAMLLEIPGYYIPWIDHALDSIAAPASVIAGTITTAALAADLSPLLKWTTALIDGGGIAGLVQASTVALRAKNSLSTGGVGNPIFSTFELGSSIVTALLAIFIPIVCLVIIILFHFCCAKSGQAIIREKSKK